MRPLAWDARGHGLTDKPDAGYEFDSITRDLSAFIQSCNLDQPILVGHSWGGHLVLSYAAHLLVGPFKPSGLVLVDGGITQLNDLPGATWESTRDRLTPPRLAGTLYQAFLTRMESWESYGQSKEMLERIIMHNFNVYVDDQTGEELIEPHLSFEHHMEIVRSLWEFKTYQAFKHIHCPVLMVPASPSQSTSGMEKDYLAYKERGIKVAKEYIPDLKVQWMPDTIHDIPLQRPQELAKLIVDFSNNI